MRITHKIALVLILPLLLLMSYHFLSINSSFDRISNARALVFVQSAEEVKFASQVQNYSSLLGNKLFEISAYQQAGDAERLTNAVQLYREIQQQRYYSFRELKETVEKGGASSDEFLNTIDANRDKLLSAIELHLNEIDSANERIIGRLGLQPQLDGINDSGADALFLEVIPHSRNLDESLGEFIDQRYQKVERTSSAVQEIEQEVKSTLLFGVLLGYVIAAIMILYIHHLVVKPLEKFALLFAFDDPAKMQWAYDDRSRTDEVGETLRGIESLYARLNGKKKKVMGRAAVMLTRAKQKKRNKR
jgi:hypothetical protein